MIQKVIVQLVVGIDLAAVVPSLADQIGLRGIFPSPLAKRALLPGIVTAGLHGEAAAHRPHAKTITMLSNKCVSHFAFLAKYAVAFFRP